jgi:hypothetical protein
MSPDIHGYCDPRFARVRSTFAAHFERGEEVGAAVCVYLGDEPVADLWAGAADARTGRAWERDTTTAAHLLSHHIGERRQDTAMSEAATVDVPLVDGQSQLKTRVCRPGPQRADEVEERAGPIMALEARRRTELGSHARASHGQIAASCANH